jgi:tRNA pseudouridine38-40 synthase
MKRYKCIVEYDGTNFVGWQRQLNGYSIQEAIEKSLEKIFQINIRIHGSGRTDAGVHARGQVIHFDLETSMDTNKMTSALNHYLQKELISILKIEEVNNDFDSRRDAILRTYEYLIINRKSPLAITKNKAWHISGDLNILAMQDSISIFKGEHDFTTFRSASCEAISPVRTIETAKMDQYQDQITITFESRSFLQHQVRSMVGALKLVGDGKWNKQDLLDSLVAKDRTRCAALAPACGLYLVKVVY